jgi:hypothetical protein
MSRYYIKKIIRSAYARLGKKQKSIGEIIKIAPDKGETFFGYYDKSPENYSGTVTIFHKSKHSTDKLPSANIPIEIWALRENEYSKIDETKSYNWQQGARLQWLDDTSFIYNVVGEKSFGSKVFNIEKDSVVNEYEHPINVCNGNVGLTLNYHELNRYIPDYGYQQTFVGTQPQENGIGKLNLITGQYRSLISIKSLPHYKMDGYVNHIMICPSGDKFIFLLRRKREGKQKDVLYLSDMNGDINVVLNSNMISHYCWYDNEKIIIYANIGNIQGYYSYDVTSGERDIISVISSVGDGHPHVHSGKIYYDTYPNKIGIKSLFVYDIKRHSNSCLGSFWEPAAKDNSVRCDLHPRINTDGTHIYFDSNHTGKRYLYRMDLN